MTHLILHFVVPAVVVALFYLKALKERNSETLVKNDSSVQGAEFIHWGKLYLILMLGMLVDIDHLLASPIYDPLRCSINFHPLHSFYAIGFYFILCLPKQTRYLGIGLMIHMLLDSIDCYLTNHIFYTVSAS